MFRRELKWPTLVALAIAAAVAGPAVAREVADWAQHTAGTMVDRGAADSLAAPDSDEAEAAQTTPPAARDAQS